MFKSLFPADESVDMPSLVQGPIEKETIETPSQELQTCHLPTHTPPKNLA